MRIHHFLPAVFAAVLLLAAGIVPVAADEPALEWQRLLGGGSEERGHSVAQTIDGGYILLGESWSSASGDVSGANEGLFDLWAVKLRADHTIERRWLLGGNLGEEGHSVLQASDGGYIFLGRSASRVNGDVTEPGHGSFDCWVVKTTVAGAVEWQKLLGGTGSDGGASIRKVEDGGYIVLGSSTSTRNGDVSGPTNGLSDYWVVKLESDGTIEWQELLGGAVDDEGISVQQTADGGYILLGSSMSSASGDVTETTHGASDVWVVKLGPYGDLEWENLLGGSGIDRGASVVQAEDGGYLLVGTSASSHSGDVAGTNHGVEDVWVVKLSGTGTVRWQKLLGGDKADKGLGVIKTSDGGYALLGGSYSSRSGDVAGTNHGDADFWVVKLSGTGTVEWQKLLGGAGADWGHSIQQTRDGGYVLFGQSWSSASGDVAGVNHGDADFWVVKLASDASITQVPGGTAPPTDTDGDGLYDDVNGNGRADFADVVLYFNQMAWIAANEPLDAFDYNGNGRIDFSDLVWLFNHL